MNIIVNNVPPEMYEEIKAEKTNKDSVLGIDALLTPIVAIHRLMQIEATLDDLKKKIRRG